MIKQWIMFLITITVLMFSSYANACCSCCACAPCVRVVLKAVESGTKAAFKGAKAAHTALEKTIEAGDTAQAQAIDVYGNNVISALNAHSHTFNQHIGMTNEVVNAQLTQMGESFTLQAKSSMQAQELMYAAKHLGYENVSSLAKAVEELSGSTIKQLPTEREMLKRQKQNKENKDLFIDDDTENQAAITINYPSLKKLADERAILFKDEIRTQQNETALNYDFNMRLLLSSKEEPGDNSPVLGVDSWNVALFNAKLLVSSLQMREYQDRGLGEGLVDKTMQAMRLRTDIAAGALAWDMAIRSEQKTRAGSTSQLQYITQLVNASYSNIELIKENATGDKRELLQDIKTNFAVGNALDLLLLKAQEYHMQLQALNVGYQAEKGVNPLYGNPEFIYKVKR